MYPLTVLAMMMAVASLEAVQLNKVDVDPELYKLAHLGMGTNSHARVSVVGNWAGIPCR